MIHARRGLGPVEARVLAAILDGRLDTQRLGNAETVALARLRAAGLVDDTAAPATTRDVRFSLLLDADQDPDRNPDHADE